jgi:multisubunit Na+/H+ antiporter MnhE subunit
MASRQAVSLRRSPKRRMSPTAAMKVAATITLTPGTLSSRLTSGQPSASAAISRSTSASSPLRNST